MVIRVLLLMILIILKFPIGASAEVPLKAAFIRNHQLWMKQLKQEILNGHLQQIN